jgi:hypothetical protein
MLAIDNNANDNDNCNQDDNDDYNDNDDADNCDDNGDEVDADFMTMMVTIMVIMINFKKYI